MNLIEVSEQLKDVPDQYLMREVQNPTGSYPAYLVISELSRRKRMRESAAKQPPTTTVAEDLAQPTVPPAAPMNRLNAGLGAAPAAAESLAAQDVMAQQEVPVGMAGGGVVHAANGLPMSSFPNVGTDVYPVNFLASNPSYLPRLPETERAYYISKGLPIPPELMTEEEKAKASKPGFDFYYKAAGREPPRFPGFSSKEPIPDITGSLMGAELGMDETQPIRSVPAKPAPRSTTPAAVAAPGTPAATTTTEKPAAPKAAPYRDPYVGLAEQSLSGFLSLRAPTEQELATSRAAGRTQYEQEVPYRLGFLEEEIAKRGRDVAGRRESNINEALIQAGLGIMGSKSPRFLQAVSEGGLSGLNAYRQGVKDIRAAEDSLLTARTESAKAQMLYDQNKMGAGEKAEQRGLDAFKRSQELANTQNAAIVRTQEAMQKGPYYGALTEQALAQAEHFRNKPTGIDKTIAKPEQITQAKAQATLLLAEKGIKKPTPAQIEEATDFILGQSNLHRVNVTMPGSGGIPQGWSVQQH